MDKCNCSSVMLFWAPLQAEHIGSEKSLCCQTKTVILILISHFLEHCLSWSNKVSQTIRRKEKGNTTHPLLESLTGKAACILASNGLKSGLRPRSTFICNSLTRRYDCHFLVYKLCVFRTPIWKMESCPGNSKYGQLIFYSINLILCSLRSSRNVIARSELGGAGK